MLTKSLLQSRYLCKSEKPLRTLITPEPFTAQPLQNFFHITSKNYDFLLPANPPCSQLYVHQSDTPSSLLKKNAIHIFPESLPQQSITEKYRAHVKRLEEDYGKAFEGCKNAAELFHLSRRVRTDVRQRCRFIGQVAGKYKHYNLFKSVNELNRERTEEEYRKNGVQVSLLGKNKIYPQGPVWLPTSDTYLKLLEQYLNQAHKAPSFILDLGCGSGILSFILARMYKQAKITAVDSNKFAVETCAVNAAGFGLRNVEAYQCDITRVREFQFLMEEKRCGEGGKFQMIVANPPWLVANRNRHQSVILDGVYDNKAKFLTSTFKIAEKLLKDKPSKLLLIYSDLSQILGLQTTSIEQLCQKHNLLIHQKLQCPYPAPIQKESPLSPYKLKAKIQLYQIGKS